MNKYERRAIRRALGRKSVEMLRRGRARLACVSLRADDGAVAVARFAIVRLPRPQCRRRRFGGGEAR